jgi:DNA-binding FadR family transcriptional regulator
VNTSRSQSAIDLAAARMRAEVLALPEGALLGSEDALQRRLGISRPTMRQAARVLEREGLLRVRRGNNGGYFGARPDPGFIETTVATYLEVLKTKPEDLGRIATVLWIEVVEQAARIGGAGAAALATRFRREINALTATAGFSEVLALEHKISRHVFSLIDSPYVELIFNINANFARRKIADAPTRRDGTPEHAAFVLAWRRAKLMELEAIATADAELALLAARRCRGLIQNRVWPGEGATGAAQTP